MGENNRRTETEEFIRLPKAEFIIERYKGEPLPKHLSALIQNESMSIPKRISVKATDSCMEKAGVMKDDFVVVESGEEYYEGEILAVKLDERTMLRRLFNTKGRLRLECDSSNSPTIIVENRTPGFSILGRVIQVIKEL